MPGMSESAVPLGGGSPLQNGGEDATDDTALLSPRSGGHGHLRLHRAELQDDSPSDGRPSPLRGEPSPPSGLFSVQTVESSSEISIGLALYTSSTVFNSGMSLFAKLLGEP